MAKFPAKFNVWELDFMGLIMEKLIGWNKWRLLSKKNLTSRLVIIILLSRIHLSLTLFLDNGNVAAYAIVNGDLRTLIVIVILYYDFNVTSSVKVYKLDFLHTLYQFYDKINTKQCHQILYIRESTEISNINSHSYCTFTTIFVIITVWIESWWNNDF